MAPSAISPDAAGMPKVKGISTAIAIVAVSPGSAPIAVPAMTPATASTMLNGVSAASRNSMPGIVQVLVWCRARPRQRPRADGKRRGAARGGTAAARTPTS